MTLSITKNCLFLALAISPVASAQIVTESFETTTYPTDWVRPNDTTAKTEAVTGIMNVALRLNSFSKTKSFITKSQNQMR